MSANNVKKATPETELKDDSRMPMGKQNYILMAIGFAMIVLGFILMAGGGDDDINVFNAGKLYSFMRITLAPILVLGGFVVEVFAIMKRPKTEKE